MLLLSQGQFLQNAGLYAAHHLSREDIHHNETHAQGEKQEVDEPYPRLRKRHRLHD